jgi:hypothetical protein
MASEIARLQYIFIDELDCLFQTVEFEQKAEADYTMAIIHGTQAEERLACEVYVNKVEVSRKARLSLDAVTKNLLQAIENYNSSNPEKNNDITSIIDRFVFERNCISPDTTDPVKNEMRKIITSVILELKSPYKKVLSANAPEWKPIIAV